ncbi:MAG: hypothetical protein Q9190_003727, partial [Brigantiaea leucoxantha]
MAAPRIPHLSTLRRGQGSTAGRGRGSLGNSATASNEDDDATKDRIIQQTDQDASVSRLSAVEIGYLDDPFAKIFITKEAQRRFPIINRELTEAGGTYVRTTTIDRLTLNFLNQPAAGPRQIISLGAGSDTRYFRLRNRQPPLPSFVYHELDFPSNTAQKIAAIIRSSRLRDLIPSFTTSSDGTALDSPAYHISPVDLRSLPQPSPNFPETSSAPPSRPEALYAIDTTLPTLLISECCLIYLPPKAADNAAKYFSQLLFPRPTPLALIVYEPVYPDDPFGKVMVSNLAARGIVLQTLKKYGNLEAQRERMR